MLSDELDVLENRVPMRVTHNPFLDAVPTLAAGVDQPECRHTIGQRVKFRVAVAFLFREESRSIRDDQPHVSDARLVNAGIVDFIEDSMAQREPHVALVTERCADARFCAGSPACRTAAAAGC